MTTSLQRMDTAFFGPWRALFAALVQHTRSLSLIQGEAAAAYTSITLRQLSQLNDTPATGARHVTEAWRERFNQDTQQLISAHRDLLKTTAALTTDGLADAHKRLLLRRPTPSGK